MNSCRFMKIILLVVFVFLCQNSIVRAEDEKDPYEIFDTLNKIEKNLRDIEKRLEEAKKTCDEERFNNIKTRLTQYTNPVNLMDPVNIETDEYVVSYDMIVSTELDMWKKKLKKDDHSYAYSTDNDNKWKTKEYKDIEKRYDVLMEFHEMLVERFRNYITDCKKKKAEEFAKVLDRCPECKKIALELDKAKEVVKKFLEGVGFLDRNLFTKKQDAKKQDVITMMEFGLRNNVEHPDMEINIKKSMVKSAEQSGNYMEVERMKKELEELKKSYKKDLQKHMDKQKRDEELLQKLRKHKQLTEKVKKTEMRLNDCLEKCQTPDTVTSFGTTENADFPWLAFLDDSSWCSYWIWETPAPKKKPTGKVPIEIPRKLKDPKKPAGKETSPKKKPKGPTIIFYTETDKEDETPKEKLQEDPKKKPEERVLEKPIDPPAFIVKAKRDVLKGGKLKTEPVASAQFKLCLIAPELEKGADKGFDEGPTTGVLNKDGELFLKTQQGSLSSDNRMYQKITPVTGLAALWEGINFGISPVYAAPNRPQNNRKPVIVEVNMPRFESRILKINIDKSKKNWDDPATYLGRILGDFVSRKWIVEKDNCMYAVVNTPVTKEGQK